jgi:hypothetical protein
MAAAASAAPQRQTARRCSLCSIAGISIVTCQTHEDFDATGTDAPWEAMVIAIQSTGFAARCDTNQNCCPLDWDCAQACVLGFTVQTRVLSQKFAERSVQCWRGCRQRS